MNKKLLGPHWSELSEHLQNLFRDHFLAYLDSNGRLDVASDLVHTRRSCPVCEGAASDTLFEFLFFPIARCGACGFRYMQAFPDTLVLQKAIVDVITKQHPNTRAQKPEAEWVSDEAMKAKIDGMIRWFRGLERMVDLARLTHGTFIDIGAGSGYAVKAAEICGFRRAIGIEFDPRHVRFGRERLKVELVETPVERIELPENVSFIRMNHVLEHIERPIELLRRCRTVLANPGTLYVAVPNMRSLSVRLWSAWHRYFQPVHINYFDAQSLKAAAAAAGFPSVRIFTDNFSLKTLLSNPLAATHVGKYYLRDLTFSSGTRLALWLMRQAGKLYLVALDRALSRLFPLWGDNLVCLAQTEGSLLMDKGAS